MNSYEEMIEKSKNLPIKYEWIPFHVKALKTQFAVQPWSIAECEAKFLQKKIKERNCKSGLEIGTGTGVSCIFAGQAFKENNGKLVTLDPFIEESYGACNSYTKEERKINIDGVGGWIQDVIDELDLTNHVESLIGYSPDDIKLIGDVKLDYALIDACHNSDSIYADFEGLLPFLAEKFIIFFHDIPCIQPSTRDAIASKLGLSWNCPTEFQNPNGFNLGYLEKNLD